MNRELIRFLYREYETATTREIALVFGVSRSDVATMLPVDAFLRDDREKRERRSYQFVDMAHVNLMRRRLKERRASKEAA